MINPQELRIGNWIIHKSAYDQISGLYADRVGLGWENNLTVTTLDIYPIVLNSKILQSCGFEREERRDWDGDPFYVWYKGFDIHEGNTEEDFNYAVYVKGAQSSFKAGRAIEYVHELQNLAFILNGEELEIQL